MPAPPRPTVSVVTPCLNAAATIQRTLDSVRDQGVEIEHIVVDGGSTDGTVDILAASPGVRYVSGPDEGLSDAVNKGIEMATGDLIGWLNADDWYLPGAVQAVVDAAVENPAAQWITGRCPIVGEDGEEIRHGVTRYKNFLLRHYSFRAFLTQNFVSCPATFVRAEAYQQAGPYVVSQHYAMDYDMFLRLARVGDPIVLDRDLAVFMMAEGTKSMSGFETQFQEHYDIARAHGHGHPVPVAVNWVMSRAIVAAYRVMRRLRTRRG